MNSPLADGRTRNARTPGPAYAPRQRHGLSWAQRRLTAALGRQWWVFLGVVAIVAGLGMFAASANGTPSFGAGVFWSGAGACAGFTAAVFRELGRGAISSASSLSKHRAFAVLGAAPELSAATLRELPPEHRAPLGCLAFLPASPFATAFRDLQGALAEEKLVAFASCHAHEGASNAALCAAASAAQQGRRTILVDCDLRRRSATHALGIEPNAGLIEAVLHPDTWRDMVGEEPETCLAFLPAGRPRASWRTLFDMPGWTTLLGHLRAEYDLVVLDCPPILAPGPGAALASSADRAIVVAAWDRTPLESLRKAMRLLQKQARAPMGVFVNGVPEGHRFGRLRPG